MKRSQLLVKGDGTPEQLHIAKNRTRPHLDRLNWIDYKLEQLVVNCYMQGLRDMAEALVMLGYKPKEKSATGDFQI